MQKSNLFNSIKHYGWISILLHWLMAFALIGMYFLGEYMVDLEYYDTWYNKAPALHKAIGVIIALLIILRLLWNIPQSKPAPLENKSYLITLAKIGHFLLYALMFLMVISGYLISTAKGQGIDLFGLFEFPALFSENSASGEIAGKVHTIAAQVFILMVMLHASAALVHHFVFKDRTLKRMLWVNT